MTTPGVARRRPYSSQTAVGKIGAPVSSASRPAP